MSSGQASLRGFNRFSASIRFASAFSAIFASYKLVKLEMTDLFETFYFFCCLLFGLDCGSRILLLE
jgi:hypothetical protein